MLEQNNPAENSIEANASLAVLTPKAETVAAATRLSNLIPGFVRYAQYDLALSAQTAKKYNREQIDFENAEAKIVGKGNKERTVFFSQRALDWIKYYLDHRADKEPALFVTKSLQRMNRADISKTFRGYVKKSGITKKITPHIRVWEILTRQPFLNEWTSVFMAGSVVKGEFKDGAQILYLDPSGKGVAGKVTEYKPNEELKVSILAEITNGEPDFNHPQTKRWEGAYDYYQITEAGGTSTLSVETAFPAEFYNDFVAGWNKMLEKIKELAE